MGQNSSSLHTATTTLPRAKHTSASEPALPAPAPSPTPPPDPTPKTPAYLLPENKVIANGTIGIVNARRHLRPVSQDLTKLHPDFADVFRTDSGEKRENGSIRRSTSMPGLDKENDFGLSKTLGERQGANGHARALSNATGGNIARSDDNISMTSSGADDGQEQWSSLKRAQSADRGVDTPSKPYRHSRQTSLASRMSLQDTVILEDPREHLYNMARKEPFSNFMPNTASLPVKSTFDMDYSFNLTYAQLAEHRRQKRTAELEERTGKKLEELSVDISSASNVPKSPFDLRNLGGKPITHSLSTGSSDTGYSKSKKKAPAPPPPAIPPFRYTIGDEPPVDYDAPNSAPAQQKILRSNSSASAKPKMPAPQPFPKRHSATALFSAGQSESVLGSANHVSPPPSLSVLFNKPKPRPQNDPHARPPGFDQLQKSKAATQMQLEALKRLEETLKKAEPVDKVDSVDKAESDIPKEGGAETPSLTDSATNGNFQNETKTGKTPTQKTETKNVAATDRTSEIPTPPPVPSLTSDPASNGSSPLKSMSSLLQHDIILAAQARGAKILKPKIPSVSEKPKDPSEVFMEELAKAAQAREERRKLASANDAPAPAPSESPMKGKTVDDDRVLLFESSLLKVTKSSSEKNGDELNGNPRDRNVTSFGNPPEKEVKSFSQSEDEQRKEATEKRQGRSEEEQEEMRIAESVDMSKRGSVQSEAMSVGSSNNSQRFASDWIPEVDLDSDDDIMDEKVTPTHKRVSSEGFRSSILPSKLNDMKKEAEKKKKKKSQPVTRSDSNGNIPAYPAVDEKSKFGSVRKFKQGMRSALGSISKASGKLFKKPKSRDKYKTGDDDEASEVVFAQPDDGRLREFLNDKNWTLSESRTNSLRRYEPKPAGTDDDLSSGSDHDDVADIDFAGGIDQLAPPRGQREADSDDTGKGLKRAGVAYVSKKGQIIVLPEYNYGNSRETSEDEEGRAPKIVKKKNRKFTYESTVRVQEKSRIELEVAREILEKEKQIEVERQRQQSMEREFQRLRDLETQERLQRLQSATMNDQINLIQQQRAAQFEINNNVSGGGVSATQAYTPYFANGTVGLGNPGYINSTMPTLLPMSLPTNYTTHSSPLVGNGVVGSLAAPQMTAQEMSRISEYMRRMGVVPPSNQQQWAVLLSTISFNSPGTPHPLYDQKTALYGMGTGPNLSHIFGGVKTMDSATSESSGQLVSFVPANQAFRATDMVSQDGTSHAHTSQTSPASTITVSDMPADHSSSDSPLKSPPLSSKLYGPLGYRPVSFHNHITKYIMDKYFRKSRLNFFYF
ncbi:hypothetical protein Btru_015331 [Bulinus truncatus]|nr:hypothetical protein Btru_015331 [Bulinus truncatus]